MEKTEIMTTLWPETGVIFERTIFGISKNFGSFNELIFNIHKPVDAIYSLLEKVCLSNRLTNATERAFKMEDLSSFTPSIANAVFAIRNCIDDFNRNDTHHANWFYLDRAKRAAVHFVNKKGWYAELYILSNIDLSILLVIEDDNGKAFIPVTFSRDISEEFTKASIEGGKFLQEYPHRVFDGILGRHNVETVRRKKHDSPTYPHSNPRKRRKDNGDNL